MSFQNYEELYFKDIAHIIDDELILLVTATNLETEYTHRSLKPLTGHSKIIQVFEGSYTYYFGLFGLYKVAHVQCTMGSISRSSSIMTISKALENLKAKTVIMIGIAFGIDEQTQNIGDVLISESIIPYNSRRVGQDKIITRGIEAQASDILLNRFKNLKNHNHKIKNGISAKLIFTRLLSGEELVDNLDHRNKLLSEFPDSKGGEMEGAGVYAACGNKKDWILVKGICDFADGNKKANKRENQEIAINSALSVCLSIFNKKTAFKELNIHPYNQKETFIESQKNINAALFDYYDSEKEPYYISRTSDEIFSRNLNQFGIWVHGPSGSGKSNLIIRNILNTKKEIIQINLAPCIGQDTESFFKEILYELSSKTTGVYTQIQPTNFSECSRELISLLNRHFANKDLILFIDEIPISSDIQHKEFSERIFSLIISMNFMTGLNKIKFVLSSIEDPTVSIVPVQQKIHQQVYFLKLQFWDTTDIQKLINLILTNFNITIDEQVINELITTARGNPRFIKKFFRSLYTLNKFDTKTIKVILNETKRDLFKNG